MAKLLEAMMKCSLIISLGFGLLVGAYSYAFEMTNQQKQELSKKIEHQLKQQGGPGIAVSVTYKGDLIFTSAAGYKDVEKRIPFAVTDRLSIGSVSKTYTTFAVYKLIDQVDAVDLDTKVADILPDLGYDFKNIRLRHLLNHSSGFQRSVGGDSIANLRSIWEKQYSPDYSEIPAILSQGMILYEIPGVMYQYSNFGYALLGLVIEKLASKSGYTFRSARIDERIAQYMTEQIIEPLGAANNSQLMVASRKGRNLEATGYGGAFGQRDDPKAVRYVWPVGQDYMGMAMTHSGVISDVIGLAKFQSFFYSLLVNPDQPNPIISAKSFLDMITFEARSLNIDEPAAGIDIINGTGGLFLERIVTAGGRIFYLMGHTGTGYGSRNIWYLDPATGLGVSLIVNAKTFNRHAVLEIVLDYLAPQLDDQKADVAPAVQAKIDSAIHLLEAKKSLSAAQKALLPRLNQANLSHLLQYLNKKGIARHHYTSTIQSLLTKQFHALSFGENWTESIGFKDKNGNLLRDAEQILSLDPAQVRLVRTQNGQEIGELMADLANTQGDNTPLRRPFDPDFGLFSFFTVSLEMSASGEVNFITLDSTFRLEGAVGDVQRAFRGLVPSIAWSLFPQP